MSGDKPMGDKNPLEAIVDTVAYPFQPGNAFGTGGFFRSGVAGMDGGKPFEFLGSLERIGDGLSGSDNYAKKETAQESMIYVGRAFGFDIDAIDGKYHAVGLSRSLSSGLGDGQDLLHADMHVATQNMDRIHAVMMREFQGPEGSGPEAAGRELVDAMLDLARFQSGEALTIGAELGFLVSANDYIQPMPDGAQSEIAAMVERLNGGSETPSFGVDEATGIPYRIDEGGAQEPIQPQDLLRAYTDAIAAEHGMDPEMLYTMMNVEAANQGVAYLQAIPEGERTKYLQQAGTNIDTFTNNITQLNANLPDYFRTHGDPPRPQFDTMNHIITEEQTRLQGLMDPLGQRETEKELQEGIRDLMQEIKGFLLGLIGLGPKASERSDEIAEERDADLQERFGGREVEKLSLDELAQHLGEEKINLGDTGIDPTTMVGDLQVDQLSQLADLNTDNPAAFAALATELSSRGQEGLDAFAQKIGEMLQNDTLTQEIRDELGAYMQMHPSAVANVYEQAPILRDDILKAAIEENKLSETMMLIGDQANPDLQALLLETMQSNEINEGQLEMVASAMSQMVASGQMEMVTQILEGLTVEQMEQLLPHLDGEARNATVDAMLENGASLGDLLTKMSPAEIGEYFAGLGDEEAELAAEIQAYIDGLEAGQQAQFNMAASGVTDMSNATDVQAQVVGDGQTNDGPAQVVP
jgi:hypothetical protein